MGGDKKENQACSSVGNCLPSIYETLVLTLGTAKSQGKAWGRREQGRKEGWRDGRKEEVEKAAMGSASGKYWRQATSCHLAHQICTERGWGGAET